MDIEYINKLLLNIEKSEFEDIDKLNELRKYKNLLNIDKLKTESFLTIFKILIIPTINNDEVLNFLDIEKYLEDVNRKDIRFLDILAFDIEKILETKKTDEIYITGESAKEIKKSFKKVPLSLASKLFLIKHFNNELEEIDFDACNTFMRLIASSSGVSVLYAINFLLNLEKEEYMNNIIEQANNRRLKKMYYKAKDKINTNPGMYEDIVNLICKISNYINSLESNSKKFYQLKSKRYYTLKNLIDSYKRNELFDTKKLEKLFDDSQLLSMVYIYNNKFSTKEYRKVKEKNIKYNNNKISKIRKILLENNLHLDESKIEVEENILFQKLKYINFMNLIKKYSNIIYFIINKLELEKIIEISNLFIKNIISEEFFLENINNLKNNSLIENFLKNIQLLLDNKIDIKSVAKYNKEILFYNNNKLNYIINSYKNYGIDLSQKCYNYQFLENDYTYILDRFIEIDEFDLVKNNIMLCIPLSYIIPKRCIINKLLGNKVFNEHNKLIKELKNEKDFYLTDKEVNETIIENYCDLIPYDILEVLSTSNTFNYEDVDLSILDSYYYNDMSYKIGSLIISKNKLIKNYNKIKNSYLEYSDNEIILYSILYNYPTTIRYYDIDKLKDIFDVKKLIK